MYVPLADTPDTHRFKVGPTIEVRFRPLRILEKGQLEAQHSWPQPQGMEDLGLEGEAGAYTDDPKLDAAAQKVIDNALAPLKELNKKAAASDNGGTDQPQAPSASSPSTGSGQATAPETTATSSRPAAESTDLLEVAVEPPSGGAWAHGELTKMNFVVRNVSGKALVLLGIASKGRPDWRIELCGSVDGRVEQSAGKDAYELRETQTATEQSFCTGLLLPGQRVTVVGLFRPLAGREEFTLSCLVADGKYDGTERSLSPLRVYLPFGKQPGQMVREYVPFTARRWAELASANAVADTVGPFVSDRGVLIPPWPRWPSSKSIDLAVKPRYAGNPVLLEPSRQAAARLPAPGEV